MKATNTQVIILGTLLVLAIILLVYKIFWSGNNFAEGEMEVRTEDDDPYLKQISEFRNNFIKQVVGIFAAVWLVPSDELSYGAQNNDWNNSILTIAYTNHLVRVYIDWKRQIVKVAYTFQNERYKFSKHKTYLLRHNIIDYEGLHKWGITMYTMSLIKGYPNVEDAAVDSIEEAKQMLKDETLTMDDYKRYIMDVWATYIIHNNKKEMEADLSNFTKLTAFVMKYCPKELEALINEQSKTPDENK